MARLLYQTTNSHGLLSYSSDENRTIDTFALRIANPQMRLDLPTHNLPAYGLAITRNIGSSSSYFTLVDKNRKLVVSSYLGNMHSGCSWNEFAEALAESVRVAKLLRNKGMAFGFVCNGNPVTKLDLPP